MNICPAAQSIYSDYNICREWCDFIINNNFEYSVTFSFRGHVPLIIAKETIRKLHWEYEWRMTGHYTSQKMREKRAACAVHFFEHVETDIHTHAFFKVHHLMKDSFEETLANSWKAIRPRGTIDIQKIYDISGATGYNTKDQWKNHRTLDIETFGDVNVKAKIQASF